MDEAIGSLSDIAPSGRVFLRGVPIGRGTALAVGDELEVRDGDAFVESPGRVRLIVESGSRIRITHRAGPLVVALEEGAIEADVTPTAHGEAFAVDVEHSRVAVHGTHLRVARIGPRALVDLNEGVVTVGQAPRAGSLFGTLVVAPAHVEFAVSNTASPLSVTHEPAAVRAPAAWPGAPPAADLVGPFGTNSMDPSPDPVVRRPVALPHVTLAASASSSVDSGASSSSAPMLMSPEEAVSTAVRTCMSERPHADNVTVLFRTTLELDVGDDGAVRGARFNPPVLPDVNECAAPEIYRARFAHAGALSIPIEFKN